MFALQPEMKVFSGSANRELAQRICDYIGTPLGQATISSFPDGETYVKIDKVYDSMGRIRFSPACIRIHPITAVDFAEDGGLAPDEHYSTQPTPIIVDFITFAMPTIGCSVLAAHGERPKRSKMRSRRFCAITSSWNSPRPKR